MSALSMKTPNSIARVFSKKNSQNPYGETKFSAANSLKKSVIAWIEVQEKIYKKSGKFQQSTNVFCSINSVSSK